MTLKSLTHFFFPFSGEILPMSGRGSIYPLLPQTVPGSERRKILLSSLWRGITAVWNFLVIGWTSVWKCNRGKGKSIQWVSVCVQCLVRMVGEYNSFCNHSGIYHSGGGGIILQLYKVFVLWLWMTQVICD